MPTTKHWNLPLKEGNNLRSKTVRKISGFVFLYLFELMIHECRRKNAIKERRVAPLDGGEISKGLRNGALHGFLCFLVMVQSASQKLGLGSYKKPNI